MRHQILQESDRQDHISLWPWRPGSLVSLVVTVHQALEDGCELMGLEGVHHLEDRKVVEDQLEVGCFLALLLALHR